jgi:uncharacterized membrane protein
MTWLQRYHLRHFRRFSFWAVPVLWMLGALIAVRVVWWLDHQTDWAWFEFTAQGAREVLGSLASSMLTFIVFAVSSLFLAAQLASSQLTPRIISLVFALRRVKVSVGVFVFAYTFALGALGRIEGQHVPQLLVFVSVLSTLVSIALFFWFVQQAGMSLWPVFILEWLWEEGRQVIDTLYPRTLEPIAPSPPPIDLAALPKPVRVIAYIGNSGTFLAFDTQELVAAAQQAECVIEIVPQVRDFVSCSDPLFRIYPAESPIAEEALQQMVAFGPERTLEQDPGFAFRIMVDIASRALSPAVNDPTTAVLALDQIHRLLRSVGEKQLDPGTVCDGQGKLRLLYLTPQWEDFVSLAVSEIRLFGASSIQVPRRLRAMLEHLIGVLPDTRGPALRRELTLLQRAVARDYPETEDRQRAEISDRQGIGGSSGLQPHVDPPLLPQA